MKSLLYILLIIAGLLEGCKKYEDGPIISFRSVHSRISGFHTLTKYSVDGIDSLSQYYDSLGLTFNFIPKYDEVNDICWMSGKRKDGGSTELYWGYKLTNSNTILKEIGPVGFSKGIGVFKPGISNDWQILKLKKNDIVMKTNYNGKEYLIELETQK